ncbi:hypothetical protein L195_g024283 [Trifolium pratense]|uniref:Uncharacterized protein n=1 Tax=Trifolium pratense TaxID=57577 RepID=A0A2K3ND75_TRIPR|nr:hypothetical protein L195_g024283 [Trifolium pratense]
MPPLSITKALEPENQHTPPCLQESQPRLYSLVPQHPICFAHLRPRLATTINQIATSVYQFVLSF